MFLAFSWRPASSMQRKLTKAFLWMAVASSVLMPTFYHLDMFLNPCLPIHFGAYVLVEEQCQGNFSLENAPAWSFRELKAKIPLVLWSLFNWTFTISGSTFEVAIGLLLKCHCLRNYVCLAMFKLRKDQNTRTCMMYRELQIMAALYREIYSRYMTQAVLASFITMHIIGVYSCVKFGLQMPLPMFLVFANVSVVSMFMIVYVYTCLASVYLTSKELLLTCKGLGINDKNGCKSRTWFRRFTCSFRILRIDIGYANFVDETTPLQVENFVTSQTAGLMCM